MYDVISLITHVIVSLWTLYLRTDVREEFFPPVCMWRSKWFC